MEKTFKKKEKKDKIIKFFVYLRHISLGDV